MARYSRPDFHQKENHEVTVEFGVHGVGDTKMA